MALPLEEKMKYWQGDSGRSFGQVFSTHMIVVLFLNHLSSPVFSYKGTGESAVNAAGEPDTVEMLNVSKDDAESYPVPTHCVYPSTVNARMESTIQPFVKKSMEINYTLFRVLNERLGLPEGVLESKHLRGETSGSISRVIKNPPPDVEKGGKLDKLALGAHTDFGSLVSCFLAFGLCSFVVLLMNIAGSLFCTTVLVVYRSCLLDRSFGVISR
jgi:isopenicillin N synthase-like dioxygenase